MTSTDALAPTPRPVVRFVNPAGLYDPRPNGYSHVALTPAGCRWIHASGQGGEDVHGALAPDFERQVLQALRNLVAALAAGGAGVGDVVRLQVLVVDHSEERLTVFGRALAALWGERPPPACTLIPVPRLALDGMLFEIEATAALPA